jgi:hypothetical protein
MPMDTTRSKVCAVVLEDDLHRKPCATGPGQRRLLRRNRVSHAGNAVVLTCVLHEGTEAAADIEHAHARREAQLAAHQVELRALRALQRVALRPVGAGVDHLGVEHALEEIVARIVVHLGHAKGPRPRLKVDHLGEHLAREGADSRRVGLEAGGEEPGHEVVEVLGAPVAVHVRLADPHAALEEGGIGPLVVHANVAAGAGADGDARLRQRRFHGALVAAGPPRFGAERQCVNSKRVAHTAGTLAHGVPRALTCPVKVPAARVNARRRVGLALPARL